MNGRTLGPVADAILQLLSQNQAMTSLEMAYALQSRPRIMSYTCYRLVKRKRIRVVDFVRVPGITRLVPKYALMRELKDKSMQKIIMGITH